MTRPARHYYAWMRAIYWSVCARCTEAIPEGSWQGLADVPGEGRRWIHEACVDELAAACPGSGPTEPRPAHDLGIDPATDHAPAGATGGGGAGTPAAEPVVRVLVVGSVSWPRERAVEVRDAIAAIARGHRRVLLVHAGRVGPDTGRLVGVDAWTELSATRLGLEVTRLGAHPERHDRASTQARHQVLVDAGADVVLAFALTRDPATGAAITDPVTADAITRAEIAGLAVADPTRPDVEEDP